MSVSKKRASVAPSKRASEKPAKAAKLTKAKAARAPSAAAEPPLVLIVDDFIDAREMYREYLAFAGFRAAEARNGSEAIEQALELSPSVILMDLAMPTMDGWEATRRLKADARTREIPVIAITGHALSGDAERARAAGCDGVLSKPCLPNVVADEVRRALAARS